MLYDLDWEHTYSDECRPNFETNTDLARHRWYQFKEGYSAGVVNRAIAETMKGRKRPIRVLDPFSGSGTTALATLTGSNYCTAVEVNPFMDFVGRTKCHSSEFTGAQLRDQLDTVISARLLEVDSPLENYSTFGPRDGREKWLFNRSVLRGFEGLSQAIDGTIEDKGPFRLALLAAAMDCSNARRDGKCLRYKRGWKNLGYSSLELRERFRARVLEIIRDLVDYPVQTQNGEFLKGDCRTVMPLLDASSYDLVLFSPPYLNSFDYTDVYRPELFLGGFVADSDQLRALRANTLRSHVQYNWERYDTSNSPEVSRLTDSLRLKMGDLWDRRIPDMVDSYFADMGSVLSNAHRVARRGASLWIVVSTSAYAGTEIPVDLLLADTATRSGWRLEGVHVLRHIRAASQHVSRNSGTNCGIRLRESLVRCSRR